MSSEAAWITPSVLLEYHVIIPKYQAKSFYFSSWQIAEPPKHKEKHIFGFCLDNSPSPYWKGYFRYPWLSLGHLGCVDKCLHWGFCCVWQFCPRESPLQCPECFCCRKHFSASQEAAFEENAVFAAPPTIAVVWFTLQSTHSGVPLGQNWTREILQPCGRGTLLSVRQSGCRTTLELAGSNPPTHLELPCWQHLSNSCFMLLLHGTVC